MLKYRITEKGIKKAQSVLMPGMTVIYAERVLKYLRGFQTTGKTREQIQERYKHSAEGKIISKAIRHLIQKGYVQSVAVAGKDTPAISQRSPQLSRKTPRITPKVGRLK